MHQPCICRLGERSGAWQGPHARDFRMPPGPVGRRGPVRPRPRGPAGRLERSLALTASLHLPEHGRSRLPLALVKDGSSDAGDESVREGAAALLADGALRETASQERRSGPLQVDPTPHTRESKQTRHRRGTRGTQSLDDHARSLPGSSDGGSTSSNAPNPGTGPSMRNISTVRSGSTWAWLRNARTFLPVSCSIMLQ
jgi:hypothetical protein